MKKDIYPKGYNTESQTQDVKPTRQFVTGGAGFIGSHLVDRLLNEGNSVTVYDSLISGRRENIQHHFGKDNFHFLEADLRDFDTLKEAVKNYAIVWHLGANTGIPLGNKITDLDLKNCTIATYNVLEAVRQNGIKQLLFTSTSAVYGDIEKIPTAEEDGPTLPISLYGAGKLAGEGLISAYCHLFNIRALMFRFGNVVGYRMSHGVIFDFIHKLKQNPKELTILGDGTQDKNYFLVEDCIEGMLWAFYNSPKQYDVFNLGSETNVDVATIAQIVVEEMSLKDVQFQYTGGKRGWPGDVPTVHFNLSKISKLGWEPKHSSAEAVRIATRRLLGKDVEL
ncbi:NAD-dependent epimerase/dehydratase family protein [Chloroflexota bacterium]